MKTTFTIGAAALLSLLALQPAIAQDTSSASSAVSSASSAVSSAVSSEPSSAPSSEPSSAPSSEPEKDNYGSLISSLQTGAAVDLTTITDTTTVNFVTVSSLKTTGQTNALDNALDKNKDAITKLRTDVGAHAVLSAKLTAANYTADQVVAVVTEADGSVTVYIDDRA
jgi:cytoskeletal protein RodZ